MAASAFKFSRVGTDTVSSHDELNTLWSVSRADGTFCGFVASSERLYKAPSGDKHLMRWGYAVHKDEFLSGVQFAYHSRKEAVRELTRLM